MSDKATPSIERRIVAWLWVRYVRRPGRLLTVEDYTEDRPAEKEVGDILAPYQRAALALREAVLAKERELDGFRKALGRDPLVKCEWYDSARDALAELDKLEGRP